MARYVLRRLLIAVPTLLVIATLAFVLLHATPGGPFDSDRLLVPQIQHSIEARYHLDEPVWRQFLRYLHDLAHGDLGPSFQYRNTSVNELIAQGLPVDVAIGGTAMLMALLAGGAAGLLAATRPGSWRDRAAMGLAMLGISVPVFVTAPLLILLFAMRLHWLPAGDWVAGSWRHLLLPALALALPYGAYIARIVRAAAIDALSQPYIRTARAKGLPTRTILWRHASRATLMPLVSFLGPALAGVLTGSIVIEQVFGLPGIGRLFVNGALNRDYTVVTGVTVLYGALIIAMNLLVDLCYAWLDPRTPDPLMTEAGYRGGLWSESWRRLRARPSTRYAALLLGLIIAAAVLVPWLSPNDYSTPVWTQIFAPPSLRGGRIFGSDGLGRDLLVRVMWGCRISLLVGIAASLISVAIGVLWGATAGYLGGRVDGLLMRTVDVLYTLPFIPLVIVLEVLFGRNFLLVFVAIGAVSWLDIARMVRGQTLSIRAQEYVEAARALGVRTPAMIWRHVVPNLIGLVAVYATLTIPSVILFEAVLSFLGLGVHEPLASLGSLVADGVNEMQAHPPLLIFPAVFLAAIILCFNRLGDALRDALDPRDERS